MTQKQRRSIPTLVAAAITATGALALAAEPTVQEMQKQIESLQTQLTEIQSTQRKQLDSRDVDATVAQVMADAQKRSQLMALEGFTAGFNNGKFTLQSADGTFSLSPAFQMQLRHVINYADQPGGEDVEHGFEIRRLKFGVAGHAFSKNVDYDFVWATNRNGGNLVLEDAIVAYKFDDSGWKVFGGQFKDPVWHEEMTSSKRQMAVDRSLLNEALGGGVTDRTQGVGASYEKDALMATVVYHDGANQDNTNFLGGPDFGVSGRVEYTVMGDKKNYSDFTALGTKDDLLVIGAGGDWTQTGGGDAYFHTVDAQFETAGGLGLYGAYVAAYREDGANDAYDFGGLGQISYLLPDSKWEVFGRYAYIDIEDEPEELHEITGGVNYYIQKHNAKFTVDLSYLPNGAGAGGDSGIGYVDSAGESQFVLRSQFQLVI